MKVLIADNAVLVRERLAVLISGIKDVELVAQASDADETLEIIQRSRPDFVILDTHMPGSSGIQVLESIKASTKDPVIVMLAAFTYPQYRKKCLELGADFFVDKTMDIGRVVQVLQQLGGKTGTTWQLAPDRDGNPGGTVDKGRGEDIRAFRDRRKMDDLACTGSIR